MKQENEITVSVTMPRSELLSLLSANRFLQTADFLLEDTYFLPADQDLTLPPDALFQDAVLLRRITHRGQPAQVFLTAKHKEYGPGGNILRQQQASAKVASADDAAAVLKLMGRFPILQLKNESVVWERDGLSLCVQLVNQRDLYIEAEENPRYPTIQDLIHALEQTGIRYDSSTYFAKKVHRVFDRLPKKEMPLPSGFM